MTCVAAKMLCMVCFISSSASTADFFSVDFSCLGFAEGLFSKLCSRGLFCCSTGGTMLFSQTFGMLTGFSATIGTGRFA